MCRGRTDKHKEHALFLPDVLQITNWSSMLDQFKLTDEPIRQAPLDESTIPFYPNLSWLHYERLLRVKDADARLWYLKEAAREQWDYRTLQRNISSQYYYRLLQTPEHLRKEVSDEMRSLTSDFEKRQTLLSQESRDSRVLRITTEPCL